MKRSKMDDIINMVIAARDKSASAAKLLEGSGNQQSELIRMRCLGSADAFSAVAEALTGRNIFLATFT